MSGSKHFFLAVLVFVGVVLIGGAALIWPSYREWVATNRDLDTLHAKTVGRMDQALEIRRLTDELTERGRFVQNELKAVPATDEIQEIMRALSLPVDGVTIYDQTFTAGAPRPASGDENSPIQAMPLTIDMEGRFDAIFATLRAAESADRLIRVSSLSITAARKGDESDESLVKASIGLEAMFEPPAAVQETP